MLGLPLIRITDTESFLDRSGDALTTFNVRADTGARSRCGTPEQQRNAHFLVFADFFSSVSRGSGAH